MSLTSLEKKDTHHTNQALMKWVTRLHSPWFSKGIPKLVTSSIFEHHANSSHVTPPESFFNAIYSVKLSDSKEYGCRSDISLSGFNNPLIPA